MSAITVSRLYELYSVNRLISIDSRKVEKGALFFAIQGENFDGNLYAKSALESGAQYSIVSDKNLADGVQIFFVEDTLKALQELAKMHRQKFAIPVIGLTGTNGKTTTKELLYATLSQQYKTHATQGNFNNHIGVPLTLLAMPLDTEIAIVEMGANHQGEIAGYCTYALPTIGIINNCGKAHLEGFGSEEGVRKAKGELYDFIRENGGLIFRNADLDYLETMANGIPNQITYGEFSGKIKGKALEGNDTLNVAIISSMLETVIPTALVGNYNLPNVLAAVAVGNYFNIPIEKIKEGIANYKPSNSRSQIVNKETNKIILDAYNANPTSMKLAIENFSTFQGENKWLILGSMKELGNTSEAEHRAIIQLLEKLQFNQVYLVGDEYRLDANPYPVYKDVAALNLHLELQPITEGTILLKGSRSNRLEFVLDML